MDRNFWQRRNKTGKKSRLSVEERKHLGLDRPITRRDFIKIMMVGAGSLMLPGCFGWTADSNSPPTQAPHPINNSYFCGNSEAAFSMGHRVRDGENFDLGARDTGELYDLVVVGAGLGGLTSAYFYNEDRPDEKILLLDNHANFGGDAAQRFGRIAFAHTDLNGIADNQGTTRVSRRAVNDLLA